MLIDDKVDAVFIPDSPSRIKANDYNQIKNEIQECITLAGLQPTKNVIQLPEALTILTQQSGAEEIEKIEQAGATERTLIQNEGSEQAEQISTLGGQYVQNAQEWATKTDGKVDDTDYSAKYYAQNAAQLVANKQDKLTAGNNIVIDETTATISATGSGFDFEGTLAEYEQAQPTLADDAKCLITDDVGSIPTEITQEQLNDKADRDLSNCTRPYVVEQYNDGNGNGYRVWSNKFCEQWGIRNNGAWTQVTLLKEYRDSLYSILTGGGDSGGGWPVSTVQDKTTFYIGSRGTQAWSNYPVFWKTEGYTL